MDFEDLRPLARAALSVEPRLVAALPQSIR
jgi:hypothetical protein